MRGFEVWERGLRYGQESGEENTNRVERLKSETDSQHGHKTCGRSATCVGRDTGCERRVCVETCVWRRVCGDVYGDVCERLARDLREACERLVRDL